MTGILHNLAGARSKKDLDNVEAALTFSRSLELSSTVLPATRDLAEVREIHKHLFQDVYGWAGQIRTIDIRKNSDGAGFFLPVGFIEHAAGFTFEQLTADALLRGMTRDQFIPRLAYHYDQLNYIHPFREGNGRVQRVFWDRVAKDAGWSLDWTQVTGAVNDAASRAAAEIQDLGPLMQMFDVVVATEPS